MVLTHLPAEFVKKKPSEVSRAILWSMSAKKTHLPVKYFAASISGRKISAFEVKACAESKIS